MNNKTILITGSTSGIGKAGALELGRQGWRVLVHARSEQRGRPVLDELRAAAAQARFDLVTGDLSSLASVVALADQVKALTPVLDVLWNNAGGMVNRRQLTADGVEWQMGVNHLAAFALTHRLLPLLQAAPRGRVIATSSMAHAFAPGPVTQWFDEGPTYKPFAVYGKSKLANLLFTQTLARRLAGTQVTAHSFHPGFVNSGFGSGGGPKKVTPLSLLSSLVALSPAKGADTGVFLATASELGASGQYWERRQPKKPGRWATAEAAALLWQQSEALVDGL